jgi:RNA polymerase sigma-70 factor (ECF subfamily)
MTEEQIVKGCLKKNPAAQRELYDLFAQKMMGVCVRYANNYEDAEDILQEGFIKVFEKINQFKATGPLGGWIRMIMINTALIHIRKNKKWQFSEDVTEMVYLSNEEHSVLDEMAAEELLELIKTMPPGYKTVFNLFAIEGFSHKEIAEELGVSESTSKTQFLKAKAHLRKQIEAPKKEQNIE